MIRRFDTVDTAIDGLGGTIAVGILTNRDKRTVSAWRARGRFPGEVYLLMAAAAAALGFSVNPKLFGLEDPAGSVGLKIWFARIERRLVPPARRRNRGFSIGNGQA